MSFVNRSGTVAIAAVLAAALLAPAGAQAHDDRIAVGGLAAGAIVDEGPAPPFYPYYHYGQYGYPVHAWGPGPYWAADPSWGDGPFYGCHPRAVWTGHHWRHVRVCD